MIIDIPYNPGKSAMLARYGQAFRELRAIKDSASEEFIMASAWRRETRKAALAVGATIEEIKEIEAQYANRN